MTQHTKGPWAIREQPLKYDELGHYMSGLVIEQEYINVAEVCGAIPPIEAIANARLIAAAPNLLEDLKLALSQLQEVVDMNNPANWLDNSRAVIDSLNETIAKAEGRG